MLQWGPYELSADNYPQTKPTFHIQHRQVLLVQVVAISLLLVIVMHRRTVTASFFRPNAGEAAERERHQYCIKLLLSSSKIVSCCLMEDHQHYTWINSTCVSPMPQITHEESQPSAPSLYLSKNPNVYTRITHGESQWEKINRNNKSWSLMNSLPIYF